MVKKHNTSKPGGGRTNAIFKIAGAHFKDKKSNKPKEVTSKLKMVSVLTLHEEMLLQQYEMEV